MQTTYWLVTYSETRQKEKWGAAAETIQLNKAPGRLQASRPQQFPISTQTRFLRFSLRYPNFLTSSFLPNSVPWRAPNALSSYQACAWHLVCSRSGPSSSKLPEGRSRCFGITSSCLLQRHFHVGSGADPAKSAFCLGLSLPVWPWLYIILKLTLHGDQCK